MKIMKFCWLVVMVFVYSSASTQDSLKVAGLFEGKILYQFQITNPNPVLISDKEFYETMPNQGISEFQMYIKGNRYRMEYPDRIEIYSPSMNQVTIVSLRKNDSTGALSVYVQDDSVKKVTKLDVKESILGYSCEAIEVKAKWETRTFYFNATQLKTNSSYWKNHQRDFYANYFSKSSNFPLLIIRKSMLGNYEARALRIERMAVSEELFKLP